MQEHFLATRTRPMQRGRQHGDALSDQDMTAVLDKAQTLQRAAEAGQTQSLLRGKKLGLLRETDVNGDGDAVLFRSAAMELGAHVAHIRPSLSALSTPQEVLDTARVLGRLYDAVECQGLTPALVCQIGIGAGVPVYDGLASQTHPTSRLAALLEGETSVAEKRRVVLQAVLLNTIA